MNKSLIKLTVVLVAFSAMSHCDEIFNFNNANLRKLTSLIAPATTYRNEKAGLLNLISDVQSGKTLNQIQTEMVVRALKSQLVLVQQKIMGHVTKATKLAQKSSKPEVITLSETKSKGICFSDFRQKETSRSIGASCKKYTS